jgi:hypothetical protein
VLVAAGALGGRRRRMNTYAAARRPRTRAPSTPQAQTGSPPGPAEGLDPELLHAGELKVKDWETEAPTASVMIATIVKVPGVEKVWLWLAPPASLEPSPKFQMNVHGVTPPLPWAETFTTLAASQPEAPTMEAAMMGAVSTTMAEVLLVVSPAPSVTFTRAKEAPAPANAWVTLDPFAVLPSENVQSYRNGPTPPVRVALNPTGISMSVALRLETTPTMGRAFTRIVVVETRVAPAASVTVDRTEKFPAPWKA